jgi:SAM-dependent methyltransferase
VPEGGDDYLLRHIIHDWDDDRSVRILRNCCRVLRPEGRVLSMLLLTGGKERTEAEYRALFAEAGLEMTRVVPATAMISVIEGVPVA